jgi:hypothetical protein
MMHEPEIETLEWEGEAGGKGGPGRLLPPGMFLNVNHPGALPRGVRVKRQGHGITSDGGHAILATACVTCTEMAVGDSTDAGSMLSRPDGTAELPDSDTTDFLQDYVTIVPMRADYTAEDWRRMRSLLGGDGWAGAQDAHSVP